jgi:tripartite-type tricarboxylate transporter receptor subunit TctC
LKQLPRPPPLLLPDHSPSHTGKDMHKLLRRAFLATLLAGVAGTAAAQAYPSGPVRIVVPFLAGGAPDTVSRVVGERLSAKWGKPVVIDNKPGASGAIGAQALKTAQPDGLTLLMAVSSLVQTPHLVPNTPYDPIKDFAPVSHVGGTHLALLVNSSVPANTVQEFIAYAKARPGKVNYASYGVGSLSHLFGEVFNDEAGVDLMHVAYKGDSPALMDLIEGRVESAFLSVFFVRQHLASGKVKLLAVTGSTRSPLVPNAPTMAEAGVQGLGLQGWFGLFAPSGTPGALVDRISGDVREVLSRPDVKAKLLESGIVAGGSTPADFAKQVRSDYGTYGEIIRKHKITLN